MNRISILDLSPDHAPVTDGRSYTSALMYSSSAVLHRPPSHRYRDASPQPVQLATASSSGQRVNQHLPALSETLYFTLTYFSGSRLLCSQPIADITPSQIKSISEQVKSS
jgi:hypothetical protein